MFDMETNNPNLLISFQEVLSIMEPHLVIFPANLSLLDKVLQLLMSGNANAKLYMGGHHKRSKPKLGLNQDATSSIWSNF